MYLPYFGFGGLSRRSSSVSSPWPTPSALFAKATARGLVLTLAALVVVGCSDRDAVSPPDDPDPTPTDGTLDLSLDFGVLVGRPGIEESGGEPLDLTLRITQLVDGFETEVTSESSQVSESATSTEIELSLAEGADYTAHIEVRGSRTRAKGSTDVGLLHKGQTPSFSITAEQSTSVAISLEELVPQLWIQDVEGVAHELRWSPVGAAVRYQVQRIQEGAEPQVTATTELEQIFELPPGIVSGGSNVNYRVQAVLADGSVSAFSESQNAVEPGSIPPAAVSDLAVTQLTETQVIVEWTTPGDDGLIGRADRYELRYGIAPIDEVSFSSALLVSTAPPNVPGTPEFAVISDLAADQTYYVALVTYDEADNRSPLSNVLEITTPEPPDADAPTAVNDLTASVPEEGVIELRWTAPADDRDGAAQAYELRYSTSELTEQNFAAATIYGAAPSPASPGTEQQLTIRDLEPGDYQFALRSTDAAENRSLLSNVAMASNRDQSSPDPIEDLAVTDEGAGSARLRWSATGDNGRTGRAARHDIRYATFEIDDTNFKDATPIDAPDPGEPGTSQELLLSDLQAETTYWFALRVYDEANNRSRTSNLASMTTGDFETPGAVTDMVAEEVTGTRATFYWTAPGDNGDRGTATTYDLRFSFDPITDQNFDEASQVGNMPAPSEAGTNEVVQLVASETVEVYLGMKVLDEVGNESPLSNVIFVRFGDDPPTAPTGLSAEALGPDQILLSWNFAPDDEEYFEVERKGDGEADFRRIGVIDRNGFAPTHARGASESHGRPSLTAVVEANRDAIGQGDTADGARISVRARISGGSDLVLTSTSSHQRGGDIQATNVNLTERSNYTYRVRAFGAGGPSAYSNEATARTLLAAPSGFEAEESQPGVISLTWDQQKDTDNYEIRRARVGEGMTRYADVSGDNRSFEDDAVSPGATYQYQVVAEAEGQTAATDIKSALTGDVDPECSVETTGLDFGDVEIGSRRGGAVFITNTGGGTLSARLVSECSDFLVEDAPFELEPGARAVREVVFQPTRTGEQRCVLAISGGCGTVIATGAGFGQAVCEVESPDLYYGEVEIGQRVDRDFIIRNVGNGVLEGVPKVIAEGDFRLLNESEEGYRLAPNESVRLTVRFQPTAEGRHFARVQFGNDGCTDVDLIGLGVGEALGCEWSNSSLDLGELAVGSSRTVTVEFRNRSATRHAGRLELQDCNLGLSVEGIGNYDLQPGQSRVLNVTFAPQVEGLARCAIRPLPETGSADDCVPLEISGLAVVEEACELSSTEIDFGTVEVGGAESRALEVSNMGSSALVLRPRFDRDCSAVFSTRGNEFRIEPGTVGQIIVVFAPTTAGQSYDCAMYLGEGCSPIELRGSSEASTEVCYFDPQRLTMGDLVVGESYRRTFRVHNTSSGTLNGTLETNYRPQVVSISMPNFIIPPGSSQQFEVTVNAIVGEYGVSIFSDALDCEPMILEWTGVQPVAECSVTPPSLVFASPPGVGQVLNAIIENTGTTTLELDVGYLTDSGPFRIIGGAGPRTLFAGETHTVSVYFEPTEGQQGAHVRHLRLAADENANCTTLTMLGTVTQ